jgi:hypothetical protein
MKRKFFLTTVIVVLIAIIGGMSSCKKEESSIVNKRLDTIAVAEKPFDYDKYIDDLSKETGIDIRKFSKDKLVRKMHQEVNNFADDLDVTNCTQEDSIMLAHLYEQMMEAAQNLDMETFNVFYNQLLHLLYGDNIPIYMYIDNVHEFAMQNVANLQQIETSYPQLGEISEIKKQEVLSAAFYLISNGAKNLSGSPCLQAYNNARIAAIASFEISMTLCVIGSAGGPWITAGCVAWAGISLGWALHAAEVALNNCG